MRNTLLAFLVFAVFLFCGSAVLAAPVCTERDTHQLFWYVIQPTFENPATMASPSRHERVKLARDGVRQELDVLHTLVNLESDTALTAYFDAKGRTEVGAWIISKGGYKYLAPRVLCFKRNYKPLVYWLVEDWATRPEHPKSFIPYVEAAFDKLDKGD